MTNSPLRILAIDDDEETRELLSAMLSAKGYLVTACASAEDGLELASTVGFDVILSDLHLDGMDGIQLCARLGETRPTLPVIVITAFGDARTEARAAAAGAFDLIHKPVELPALCAVLDRAGSSRRDALVTIGVANQGTDSLGEAERYE